MRIKDYTIAAETLLRGSTPPDDVFVGLKKVLTANHHLAFYPKILRSLKDSFTRSNRRDQTRITLARETDKKALKEAIAKTATELEATEPFTYVIDETTVGGYRVESKGKSFDNTHKTQLQALYKSLTESL